MQLSCQSKCWKSFVSAKPHVEKVLSHPGNANSECCIVGTWTCNLPKIQCLERQKRPYVRHVNFFRFNLFIFIFSQSCAPALVRFRHTIHLVRVWETSWSCPKYLDQHKHNCSDLTSCQKCLFFVATNTSKNRPQISLEISSGVRFTNVGTPWSIVVSHLQILKHRLKMHSLAWQLSVP